MQREFINMLIDFHLWIKRKRFLSSWSNKMIFVIVCLWCVLSWIEKIFISVDILGFFSVTFCLLKTRFSDRAYDQLVFSERCSIYVLLKFLRKKNIKISNRVDTPPSVIGSLTETWKDDKLLKTFWLEFLQAIR